MDRHTLALLDSIALAPLTRADAAKILGLAPSTASLKVAELLEAGLVRESGRARSQGGRPGALLKLAENNLRLALIDVGVQRTRVVLTDLARHICAEAAFELPIATGPTPVAQAVAQAIRALGEDGSARVVAGAVSLPGPLDFLSQRVQAPSRMPGWHGSAFSHLLATLLDIPVVSDNDANASALGEYSGRPDAAANSITVLAGMGIGTGIMVHGALYRGVSGAAGDITHTKVEAAEQMLCTCGKRGCLETVASGEAIVARLRDTGHDVHELAQVIELNADGNASVTETIGQAGAQLGQALSTVVNFFNPGDLYLTGPLAHSSTFVAAVRAQIYERCLPMATQGLRILSTEPVQGGTGDPLLRGLAELAMAHVLSQTSTGSEWKKLMSEERT